MCFYHVYFLQSRKYLEFCLNKGSSENEMHCVDNELWILEMGNSTLLVDES